MHKNIFVLLLEATSNKMKMKTIRTKHKRKTNYLKDIYKSMSVFLLAG